MNTQEWINVLEEELHKNFDMLQLKDPDEFVQAVKYFVLRLMYEREPLSVDSQKVIAYFKLFQKYIIRK